MLHLHFGWQQTDLCYVRMCVYMTVSTHELVEGKGEGYGWQGDGWQNDMQMHIFINIESEGLINTLTIRRSKNYI